MEIVGNENGNFYFLILFFVGFFDVFFPFFYSKIGKCKGNVYIKGFLK